MKLQLDFEDLESQWKTRQLDLFPWLDGLFALLRSRESLIRETRRRLSSSSSATIVQFLSSDDRDNAVAAREIIKKQNPEAIFPILLYSLEKIEKMAYPHRVMESLLDFDPTISFGYLLGYLNLQQNLKDKIFQIIHEAFPLKNIFPDHKDRSRFLSQIFQALYSDLKERIPLSGKLETMEAFVTIALDLKVMDFIFQKTWRGENANVVEEEMKRIGHDLIISLHGLPFEYQNGTALFKQLSEIIPYTALMRLDHDKSFLKLLPIELKSYDLPLEDYEELIQKSEAALKLIDQPEKTIKEILDQGNLSPYLLNLEFV